MAEIFTEIIIIKKYKFCDDIWEMIKEYTGINGINLRIPNIIMSSNMNDIWSYNKMGFDIKKYSSNKKNVCKIFYDNLRLQNKENVNKICNDIITTYENNTFKVPEDLKVGEIILLYINYIWESHSDIGIVSKISKNSFTVKIKETYMNGAYSGIKTYDRIRIIKNFKYIRKEKAKESELIYFNK